MENQLKEYNKEELIGVLKEIGYNLEEELTIYMIGGCNMSLKGIKTTTKDIDLIVQAREEYENLKNALISLDYECHEEAFSKDFYKTPIIVFLKNNKRVDVFIKNVSNQIELTEEMSRRSREYNKFEKLKIMLVSNEDIFLFKSITDREKDVDDCYSLIGAGLDWGIIKHELKFQEVKVLWRFWIYEQLCRIKTKYLITTPLENYIWKLVREKWHLKPKDFMNGIQDERYEKDKDKNA